MNRTSDSATAALICLDNRYEMGSQACTVFVYNCSMLLKRSIARLGFSLFLVIFCCSRLRAQDLRAKQAEKSIHSAYVGVLNATYRDVQHGVIFRYPSVWKADTSFGMHPPALSESAESRPVAGFGYEISGFPREGVTRPFEETNLEGFGLVYSATPTRSRAACDALATSLSEQPSVQLRRVSLNGRIYTVRETGESGMSQWHSGDLYTTFTASTCYLFEADVAYVNTTVAENVADLTAAESRSINSVLRRVMLSVQISNHRAPSKRRRP